MGCECSHWNWMAVSYAAAKLLPQCRLRFCGCSTFCSDEMHSLGASLTGGEPGEKKLRRPVRKPSTLSTTALPTSSAAFCIEPPISSMTRFMIVSNGSPAVQSSSLLALGSLAACLRHSGARILTSWQTQMPGRMRKSLLFCSWSLLAPRHLKVMRMAVAMSLKSPCTIWSMVESTLFGQYWSLQRGEEV